MQTFMVADFLVHWLLQLTSADHDFKFVHLLYS